MAETNAPARIKGTARYDFMHSRQPPEISERCRWWVDRIQNRGWIGNKRTMAMGYEDATEYFGVYVWEWVHVIQPLLSERWEANKPKTRIKEPKS